MIIIFHNSYNINVKLLTIKETEMQCFTYDPESSNVRAQTFNYNKIILNNRAYIISCTYRMYLCIMYYLSQKRKKKNSLS